MQLDTVTSLHLDAFYVIVADFIVTCLLGSLVQFGIVIEYYFMSGLVSTGMDDHLHVRLAFAPSWHLINHPD